MITESDRISQAVESASMIWPELQGDRSALLKRILESGVVLVEQQAKDLVTAKRKAIETAAGSMEGIWPANWRSELRDEWPA
jgi:hypothetical protein